jgi:hypothetical protein
MMSLRFQSRSICLAALTALLLAATGCGGGATKAKGKVLLNGQPLNLSDKGVLQVALYKADDKDGKDPYPTLTKPDGTFEVAGKEGRGVPNGTYRVAVEIYDPYPGTAKLGEKYSAKSTTLSCEVGKGDIVIDVK